MSVLDLAAAPTVAKSGGPVTFSEIRPSVYDATTGKTYQLVKRDSDSTPHALTCAGKVSNPLDIHNQRAALTFQRNESESESERESLAESLKQLPRTRAIRTPEVVRLFQVYADAGIA